jgi:phosphotransacetylase
MHEVVASQTGLRTARHISHAYLMDIPDYPRPLLLTDVAINIAPTLRAKVSSDKRQARAARRQDPRALRSYQGRGEEGCR